MDEGLKETILKYLEITARTAGFGDPQSIPEIIGSIIAVFLSLLGVVFLCLIIYGGFLWMTSGGNETKVLKAKETLQHAIIGLIIILSAYGITAFVMNALVGATT
jgi:TRAP-type C4-dicarboxylate transport system permease small subunit